MKIPMYWRNLAANQITHQSPTGPLRQLKFYAQLHSLDDTALVTFWDQTQVIHEIWKNVTHISIYRIYILLWSTKLQSLAIYPAVRANVKHLWTILCCIITIFNKWYRIFTRHRVNSPHFAISVVDWTILIFTILFNIFNLFHRNTTHFHHWNWPPIHHSQSLTIYIHLLTILNHSYPFIHHLFTMIILIIGDSPAKKNHLRISSASSAPLPAPDPPRRRPWPPQRRALRGPGGPGARRPRRARRAAGDQRVSWRCHGGRAWDLWPQRCPWDFPRFSSGKHVIAKTWGKSMRCGIFPCELEFHGGFHVSMGPFWDEGMMTPRMVKGIHFTGRMGFNGTNDSFNGVDGDWKL